MYIFFYVCVCTSIYNSFTYTYVSKNDTRVYVHYGVYVCTVCMQVCVWTVCVCVGGDVYVHVHAHICVRVRVYACVCVCVGVRVCDIALGF